MVRAGWVLQYRLHGVPPIPGGRLYDLSDPDSTVKISINFLNESAPFPAKEVVGAHAIGDQTSTSEILDKRGQEGWKDGVVCSWLTIFVTDNINPGPRTLVSKLVARNDSDRQNDLLEKIASGKQMAKLRDKALFIAATFGNFFRESLMEQFVQQPILCISPTAVLTRIETVPINVVPKTNFDMGGLEHFLGTLGKLAFRGKDVSPIMTAGRWLIGAKNKYLESTEQFFANYRVVEMLVHQFAKSVPDPEAPETEAQIARLDELVAKNDPALIGFVDSLRKKVAEPSVGEKFRRFALTLSPSTAENDCRIFHILKKIRNELAHGSFSEIPELEDGIKVARACEELAMHYFLRYAATSLNSGLSLGIGGDSALKSALIYIYFVVESPSPKHAWSAR